MEEKTINSKFNHQYYCLLYKTNPKEAIKYIKQFQEPKGEQLKAKNDRDMMTKFLKDNGVRVFPNYKDETIEKKYNELKSKIQ